MESRLIETAEIEGLLWTDDVLKDKADEDEKEAVEKNIVAGDPLMAGSELSEVTLGTASDVKAASVEVGGMKVTVMKRVDRTVTVAMSLSSVEEAVIDGRLAETLDVLREFKEDVGVGPEGSVASTGEMLLKKLANDGMGMLLEEPAIELTREAACRLYILIRAVEAIDGTSDDSEPLSSSPVSQSSSAEEDVGLVEVAVEVAVDSKVVGSSSVSQSSSSSAAPGVESDPAEVAVAACETSVVAEGALLELVPLRLASTPAACMRAKASDSKSHITVVPCWLTRGRATQIWSEGQVVSTQFPLTHWAKALLTQAGLSSKHRI